MYNRFQSAKKYLYYFLNASNGKGHGIHSPFVYDFIRYVLNDNRSYPAYQEIEILRKQLLSDPTLIEVQDFGAGSTVIKTNTRRVSAIAASSLKPKKYAQLLYRMVHFYRPETILELGTSLGITTAYLAKANNNSKIYTCEGSASIAALAKKHFTALDLQRVELAQGDFTQTLPPLLAKLKTVNFAFVDGNHRLEPTVEYFEQLLNHIAPSTILVFDDIHWSAGMEGAWAHIKAHPAVNLSIDLFFMGIVFFNPDFHHKQHFTIRF